MVFVINIQSIMLFNVDAGMVSCHSFDAALPSTYVLACWPRAEPNPCLGNVEQVLLGSTSHAPAAPAQESREPPGRPCGDFEADRTPSLLWATRSFPWLRH